MNDSGRRVFPKPEWQSLLLLLVLALSGEVLYADDIPPQGTPSMLLPPAEATRSAIVSEHAKGNNPMTHHIIRLISMSHCKRGPEHCPKCRAMGGPRICLLDIAPPDQGMVQRRVIELQIDGERAWREFDVIRVFADEAEARAFAAENGIDDIDLARQAE